MSNPFPEGSIEFFAYDREAWLADGRDAVIESRIVYDDGWRPDAECRAPHCWSEYGTPCATCPKEKR